MKASKRAIVLIPGLASKEKGMTARLLVKGLVNTTETARVREVDECSVAGDKGVRLSVEWQDGSKEALDIYEAHWGDLSRSPEESNSLQRIGSGFSLLFYWFFSPAWRAIGTSKYMMVGTIFSSLLLVAWYYGVLALAFTAIGTNPETIVTNPETLGVTSNQDLLAGTRDGMGRLGRTMGGWRVWAITSILMGFLPVASLVGAASFTKRYLQNRPTEDNIGLRDKIRNRALKTLLSVIGSGRYEQVTIVAHSFGAVIGTDILADYQATDLPPLRYFTLGSQLRFLSYRSRWLREEIEKCLSNPIIESWTDFWARGDWLCADVPGQGDPENQDSQELLFTASAAEKLKGDIHYSYFASQKVMEALLS